MNFAKLKKIAKHYGYDTQSRQAIEEMAELTQAINKFWRKEMLCSNYLPKKDTDSSYRKNIAEEIADVYICLNQLEILLDIWEEVTEIVDEKIDRTIMRMEGQHEENTDTNDIVNRS